MVMFLFRVSEVLRTLRLPIRTGQPVDEAIVIVEAPRLDELEAKSLIKAVRARVAGERIDEHGANLGTLKAALERKPHHRCAVSFPEIGGFANPDVDGAEAGFDFAPVMRILERRIDDLDKTDRTPVALGDQLFAPLRRAREFFAPAPVAVRIGSEYVWLLVPMLEQFEISRPGGSEGNHGRYQTAAVSWG